MSCCTLISWSTFIIHELLYLLSWRNIIIRLKKLGSKSWKNMHTHANNIQCRQCRHKSHPGKQNPNLLHSNQTCIPDFFFSLSLFWSTYFVGEWVSVSLWWCKIHLGSGQPDKSSSMGSWVVHRCCGRVLVQQWWSGHNCPTLTFCLKTGSEPFS